MAKEYRDVSLEEEELLNREVGEEKDSESGWEYEKDYVARRLEGWGMGPKWLWIAHMLFFSASVGILSTALYIRAETKGMLMPTTYSPVQSAVTYEIQQFDLPPIPTGPFVGKGPQIDASWDYITNSIGDHMVSEEEMLAMNLDPVGALQITDPATGKRGYRVAIEVFHQLHCLDLLRQANYKSHYKHEDGDINTEAEDLHGHLDHCIDALRQFVMCQGDVNVFAFRFPYEADDPWPDYTTPRVCRNFEGIRKWAIEHSVAQGKDEPDH